ETKLPPVVVVGGLSAHRDHRIDGGAAADHLASGIGERAAVEAGLGLGAEHPVGPGIADGKEIADRDVKPDPVVVAAGFQHQHAFRGIGRQAVGHNAARSAPTDHETVEIALTPSPASGPLYITRFPACSSFRSRARSVSTPS